MANLDESELERRRAFARQIVRDLVGVAGAIVAGLGAWMHYPPAGLMVGGGIIVMLAVIGTLRDDS